MARIPITREENLKHMALLVEANRDSVRQMRELHPVIWPKETFLTPKDSQTRDRVLETLPHFRLEVLKCGVLELK